MAGKGLKGSKSLDNLKEAFAGESQANRRYLYFARVADIEGYPEVGGLFRDTSEAETGHAFGHMGLGTTGGTQGVGLSTTRSVVVASVLILSSDFFMTKILLLLFPVT